MNAERLQIALGYAARGWKVIPLHTPTGNPAKPCSCNKADCESVGKHPRTMNGLAGASADPEKVREWWEMWPSANIGIATGAESGFVVLDVDVDKGGRLTIETLLKSHGQLPEKVYANTGGGGWHIVFQHPGGHWPNTQSSKDKPSRLGAGLDFRGDGGYIVAPGSLHQSGNVYRWGIEPNGHYPAMPEWLKRLLQSGGQSAGIEVGDDEALTEGSRHPVLLAWAGAMRRKGMSATAILAALREENRNRCRPPKSDEEVRKIAEYVGSKSPQDPVLKHPETESLEVSKDTPGLYTLDAYESEIDSYRLNGLPKGLAPGWENLRKHYTILLRYLTMVTGSPTAGKSHWVNALMVNMMILHDWKFAVASPEFTPPAYFYTRFMETYAGAPFYEGPTARMSEEMFQAAKQYLREHLFFIESRTDEPLTVDFACAMAKRAREEYGVQGLVLDPWAKFAHARPDSMSETEYIRVVLNKLQFFLDKSEMHGWLVVHPKMMHTPGDTDGPVVTPYALPGSAHWYNLAHNIISLYRRKSEKSNRVEVHIQKVKPHHIGQEGVVDLYYDRVTGQYSEKGGGADYSQPAYDDEDYVPQF